jgi:phosphoserine phosphatase
MIPSRRSRSRLAWSLSLLAALALAPVSAFSGPAHGFERPGAPVRAPLHRLQPPLADALPSWREGASKRAILTFLQQAEAIPPVERIAVFDNDGTLWSEQPLYIPVLFCVDRIRQLAVHQPLWRQQEPYASALRGDLPALLRQGPAAWATLMEASAAGLTPEAFTAEVRRWLATARHPSSGRPYTAMVFQPMLELLALLRQRGFRTYIVTGGDGAFVRPWSEGVYGVPPEQVIGTRMKLAYRDTVQGPVLERLPQIEAIVDGPEKPVAIEQTIGRRPVAAFGNSDGDLQMLSWTMAGPGPRLALLVHHTDGVREWAYDRRSAVGRLDRALDQARQRGWTVVDMAQDWLVIHPPAHP